MSYISHTRFKNLMSEFQTGTLKGMLINEGNAFTAGLAKAKKGQEFKVGGKAIKDTSSYDSPNVKESHPTADQWYVDFEDGLKNLADTKYITPLELKYYMKALDHVDPMDNYSEMTGRDAAKEFVDDLRIDRYQNETKDQSGNARHEHLLDILLKYVKDVDDAENYVQMNPQEWPDWLDANMARDEDYQNYVLKHYDVEIEEEYTEDTPFKLPKRTDTAQLDYDSDASRFEPDYMKVPGEDDEDEDESQDIDDEDDWIESSEDMPKHFKRIVTQDKTRYPFKEGAVKETDTIGRFSVLSPDERKQLKEYIESVKTIKQEIAKLVGKAGHKIREGGNRTGLVMKTVTEKK